MRKPPDRVWEKSLYCTRLLLVTVKISYLNAALLYLCSPAAFSLNKRYDTVPLPLWQRHNLMLFVWSGLRGSNSPPSAWEADALPDELNPHRVCKTEHYYFSVFFLNCQYGFTNPLHSHPFAFQVTST